LVVAVEDALVVLGSPGALEKGGESVVVLVGEESRVVTKGVAEELGSCVEEVLVRKAVDGRADELSQGANEIRDWCCCSLGIQNPGLGQLVQLSTLGFIRGLPAHLEATEGLSLRLQLWVVLGRGEATGEEASNIGAVLDEAAVYLYAGFVSESCLLGYDVGNLQFWSTHVGLANLLDKRGGKPYRHPQLLAVKPADEDIGGERIVQAVRRRAPSKVQAVNEVADAAGPQVGEVHEVGDERSAQLLDHEVACAVGQRLDGPADDVLEEALCIVLAQAGAVLRLVGCTFILALMARTSIPIPVEFDDEGQRGIEADVVLAVGDQTLGQLPPFGRPLQAMQHLLDPGDGLGGVWLVEGADQLQCRISFVSVSSHLVCQFRPLTASTSARLVGKGSCSIARSLIFGGDSVVGISVLDKSRS
jgi:hypothetical protein